MSSTKKLKPTRYLACIMLSLAASITVAAERTADEKVKALADPQLLASKDHIVIQMWVDKGASLGSPESARIQLHVNGSTEGSGGKDCGGYSSCEGTMPNKTDEKLLQVYITKKNPTCVTLNWGGVWKTVCK